MDLDGGRRVIKLDSFRRSLCFPSITLERGGSRHYEGGLTFYEEGKARERLVKRCFICFTQASSLNANAYGRGRYAGGRIGVWSVDAFDLRHTGGRIRIIRSDRCLVCRRSAVFDLRHTQGELN